MVALPIRTLTRPAALQGQQNGRLDPGILKATAGQAGGLTVELVEPAARGWRALTAAAKKAGHVLKQSAPGCSYRPYAVQERIFRERYTTVNNGTPGRMWNGRYWYKKPGVAAAAVPGTSNHGWGLAVDLGEERDGDSGTESVDAGTVAWLIDNAHTYGYSAELQSEPWHWRWYVGDAIPPAVRAYEAAQKPPPKRKAPKMAALIVRQSNPKQALFECGDTLYVAHNGAVTTEGPKFVVNDDVWGDLIATHPVKD
jgi:hypothetical protein